MAGRSKIPRPPARNASHSDAGGCAGVYKAEAILASLQRTAHRDGSPHLATSFVACPAEVGAYLHSLEIIFSDPSPDTLAPSRPDSDTIELEDKVANRVKLVYD